MSQAKTKVLTADDLAGLLEKAMSKISVIKKPSRPSIDELKKVQDKAILNRELATERREKVQKAVEQGAPLKEQIEALGTEVTPIQLVKLQQQHNVPSQHMALPSPDAGQDLVRQVLGPTPSSREMEQFADLRLKLQGENVGSNERGEIEISGYPVPGSSLVTALRYLVKGSRGFKGQPPGASELGHILKTKGIASSKFPESIRPLLGGRGRRQVKHRPATDNEELGSLTKSMEKLTVVDDEPEQHGEGISLLHAAMDSAENGDHDTAWDSLNEARRLVPREKFKKAERYLASRRD